MHDTAIPLNDRVPGKRFSLELEAVIAKSLAKKREDRHETAVDFAQALRACLKNRREHRRAARTAVDGAVATRSALARHEPAAGPAAPPSKTLTEIAAAPTVPVSRGPLIAIAAAAAFVLLVLGIGSARCSLSSCIHCGNMRVRSP